jgi:hypothetical protein
MERPHVIARVYDGQKMLLCGKEYRMAMLLSVPSAHIPRSFISGTYRSSIMSRGGRLSNRPRPSNSPDWALSPLEGLAAEDCGIQGIAPSRGLLWSLSDRAASLPSVAGDEPSVPAPSERAGRLARCLPTVLSRPSTWARSGSTHGGLINHEWSRWHTEAFLKLPDILPLECRFPPRLWIETFATSP